MRDGIPSILFKQKLQPSPPRGLLYNALPDSAVAICSVFRCFWLGKRFLFLGSRCEEQWQVRTPKESVSPPSARM